MTDPSNVEPGSRVEPATDGEGATGRCSGAPGSVFWRDALDPAKGAKIIAVYPSGSTVNFTATARKTTEGRDRAVNEVSRLRGVLEEIRDPRPAMKWQADKIDAALAHRPNVEMTNGYRRPDAPNQPKSERR